VQLFAKVSGEVNVEQLTAEQNSLREPDGASSLLQTCLLINITDAAVLKLGSRCYLQL
jgi:hypothetical protein